MFFYYFLLVFVGFLSVLLPVQVLSMNHICECLIKSPHLSSCILMRSLTRNSTHLILIESDNIYQIELESLLRENSRRGPPFELRLTSVESSPKGWHVYWYQDPTPLAPPVVGAPFNTVVNGHDYQGYLMQVDPNGNVVFYDLEVIRNGTSQPQPYYLKDMRTHSASFTHAQSESTDLLTPSSNLPYGFIALNHVFLIDFTAELVYTFPYTPLLEHSETFQFERFRIRDFIQCQAHNGYFDDQDYPEEEDPEQQKGSSSQNLLTVVLILVVLIAVVFVVVYLRNSRTRRYAHARARNPNAPNSITEYVQKRSMSGKMMMKSYAIDFSTAHA